ncbi:hypothetical protein LZ554_007040 [Drepanopeziza brunnea f. sp. 'monogermtubi']|nr:hypothetical protein LZ554_007040 [Drepanopeziza brunnea f. sp. 'monogermtubi']
MAPGTPALDLNTMLNADRERRKNETLAKEIFGRNRRASAPSGSYKRNTKPGAVPSLASRIGVIGASVTKQRNASNAARPARPTARPQPAVNINSEWTHDLHNSNNLSSRTSQAPPRGPKAGRANRNERIHSALSGSASSPSLNGQFNIVGTSKPASSISIRGLAGPALVVIKNLATGTTAADIESAMVPVGGSVLSSRITSERPKVVAELVFETKEGADNVVDTFNNQNADGNRLEVFHHTGPLPAYVKLLVQSPAQQIHTPQGPRADINRDRRSGYETYRYPPRERSRERRRQYSRDDVTDGSYGFNDRMETDEFVNGGLYSDNLISSKGRGTVNNRERGGDWGERRQSYR